MGDRVELSEQAEQGEEVVGRAETWGDKQESVFLKGWREGWVSPERWKE